MIIIKPPQRVKGAPNLSKGMDVYSMVANTSDIIITFGHDEDVIGNHHVRS
jgi:hypothetical protein